MKTFLSIILLICFNCFSIYSNGQEWQCGDTLLDERDGQSYPTTQIFDNCWMAKNMNIGIMIHKDSVVSNNDIIEKYCYNNSEDSCYHYGGLYEWNEAMEYSVEDGSQGICPEGWHIFTRDEWLNMIDSLGNGTVAGGKLKLPGYRYWYTPNTGATNTVGFSGRGAGVLKYDPSNNSYYFEDIRSRNAYWSSSRYLWMGDWEIDGFGLQYNSTFTIVYVYDTIFTKYYRRSIRCVKDKNLNIGENNVESEIVVQPNPFESKTEITLGKDVEISNIVVFDMKGRKFHPEFELYEYKIILHRGNLFPGVYSLIILTDQKNILRTKIVIK